MDTITSLEYIFNGDAVAKRSRRTTAMKSAGTVFMTDEDAWVVSRPAATKFFHTAASAHAARVESGLFDAIGAKLKALGMPPNKADAFVASANAGIDKKSKAAAAVVIFAVTENGGLSESRIVDNRDNTFSVEGGGSSTYAVDMDTMVPLPFIPGIFRAGVVGKPEMTASLARSSWQQYFNSDNTDKMLLKTAVTEVIHGDAAFKRLKKTAGVFPQPEVFADSFYRYEMDFFVKHMAAAHGNTHLEQTLKWATVLERRQHAASSVPLPPTPVRKKKAPASRPVVKKAAGAAAAATPFGTVQLPPEAVAACGGTAAAVVVEYEVKLKNVTAIEFNRVREAVFGLQQWASSDTVVYVDEKSNTRAIVNTENGKTVYETKTRIHAVYKDEYLFRVSVEQPAEMGDGIRSMKRLRHRLRWSKEDFAPGIRLDITRVDTDASYEIELETSSPENLDRLMEEAYGIYARAFKTTLLVSEINKAVKDFNTVAHGGAVAAKLTRVTADGLVARPRNLQWSDFSPDRLGSGMAVALKADGLPAYLMWNGGPALSLLVPGDNNNVRSVPFKAAAARSPARSKKAAAAAAAPFIIAGELVDSKNGDYNDKFIPYDLPTSATVDYLARVREMTAILEKWVITDTIVIVPKKVLPCGDTRETLAAAVAEVYNVEAPFPVDGMIFTPIGHPANLGHSLKLAADGKVVFPYAPDVRAIGVMKWKPFHNLTVDLTVGHDKRSILAAGNRRVFPPDGITFDTQWLVPGFVYEFGPSSSVKGLMVSRRARTDKPTGNSMAVVSNLFKDMQDPIRLDVLLGNSPAVLFKQMNIAKKDLLTKSLGSMPAGTVVVDIGTGRGGDLPKYMPLVRSGKVRKIIAVEPSGENLAELRRRLNGMPPEFRQAVHIVQAGGEETAKIVKAIAPLKAGSVAVVSMLSLSFFFKSEAMLTAFGQTIKAVKADRLILATVDGFFLREAINGADKASLAGGSISIAVDYPARQVKIDIADSIVKDQTEYLVDLEVLCGIMNACESQYEINQFSSPVGGYLTEDESKFGSAFLFGSIGDIGAAAAAAPLKTKTQRSPLKFADVPDALKTQAMCDAAVAADPWAIQHVPEEMKTQAMCDAAVAAEPDTLDFVPEEMKTRAMYDAAVAADPYAYMFVPDKMKTRAMYDAAVAADPELAIYAP